MKRKNLTRNALFTSIISLLLCVSMLVGTTFAWFTDSVASANNIIKSGNLDIELEYWDGDSWENVAGKSDILTNTLWEPGVTEIAYLRVANAGSLALKYQLGINIVSETAGVNQAGKEFKLSDYIQFGVVESETFATYATREAAVADLTGAKKLNAGYTKASSMTAGQELYLALVVYMPTTVGNEANHNGEDVPSIELGINVLATQLENESDSFGDDYDEDAWDPDMVVTSASELATAIENVKDGGIIALAEDLKFDEDSRTHNSDTYYDGLYYIGDKSFTIDLNGKTITNDSAVNDYLLNFKNDGTKANTITIKNGTLEAASSAYCAICTSTTSTQKITINLENVNVIGNNSNGAVAKIRGGAELNVKAGTTITGENSYVGIEAAGTGTVVNIYEGAKIYQRGTGSYVGSLVGVSSTATANVYGGSGTSAQGCFIAMTSGGTINVEGGEWVANNDGTYANGNASVLIAQSDKGAKSTVNVTGGTFKGGYNCYGNAVGDAQINISAGTFNADPSAYVADDYKAVESSGAWTVVPENAIATSNDLITAINNAADGDTLLLAPGEYSLRFTNNTAFNVDNLNIKGMDNAKLTVSSSEAWYGRVQGDNVTFENIHFTSSVGATGKATYNNCTFDDWTICASSGNKETYFNNCDINGTLNTSTDFSSGNTYVTDSTVAKAEFSGAATMYFTNCQIGELISWDMATVLKNCVVEKQDLKMVDQKVTTIETDENGLSLATNNADPDALVLYEVPSDYAADTLVIPEGVTSIGNYAFSNNTNVKTVVLPSSVTDLGRGFDTSTVKKVVLNEGLETISSRAFKSTTALEEVVISSSVKEIADNAFQKSGIKEIVIPANVETIGETAFGSSKIEKVTIEGNTSIQGYAFRGCTNLREVYLNGDNVTFIASTLNGRNSTWFCNGESNNPNTSNITFYVVNETVAASVKAAMGAEAANTPVYVNGVLYEG